MNRYPTNIKDLNNRKRFNKALRNKFNLKLRHLLSRKKLKEFKLRTKLWLTLKYELNQPKLCKRPETKITTISTMKSTPLASHQRLNQAHKNLLTRMNQRLLEIKHKLKKIRLMLEPRIISSTTRTLMKRQMPYRMSSTSFSMTCSTNVRKETLMVSIK